VRTARRPPHGRGARRRRRWLPWLIVALAVAAGGLALWWTQRWATDLAAQVLTRAAADLPPLPDLPEWPSDAPAALDAAAPSFPFSPARPTLVVLIHGMTPGLDLDPEVGTHAYSRRYWGYAFVRALLSDRAPRLHGGEPLTIDTWVSTAPANDDPHQGLFLASHDDTAHAVLVVTRDGSRHLGEQAIATAAQIAEGVARFEAIAGEEPQLVLIGHSMGGLVGRYVLTNPEVDGGPLGTDHDTRARIDLIRDRTLYLVTLGTPHEGSRVADRAMLLDAARRYVEGEVIRPNAFIRRWLVPVLDRTSAYLRLEDPVTEHLRTDVWAALNDPQHGLLAAHRARRRDGTLVPVYALAARSPSGRFFVDPMVSDRIEMELATWYAEHLGVDRDTYVQYLLQMLLADPMLYALGLPDRGWGRVVDHPAPSEVLDLVTRVPTSPDRVTFGVRDTRIEIELAARVDYVRGSHAFEVETRGPLERYWCLIVRCPEGVGVIDTGSIDDVDLSGVDHPSVEILRALVLGRSPPESEQASTPPERRTGDGDIDADGVVSVDSALGLLLASDDWPYLAAGRRWQVGDEVLDGSWYRPDVDAPLETKPWTYLHHIDMQYDPAVARWIATSLLGVAGPDPALDGEGRSVWR
jgi:hypothetical protein